MKTCWGEGNDDKTEFVEGTTNSGENEGSQSLVTLIFS